MKREGVIKQIIKNTLTVIWLRRTRAFVLVNKI